MKLHYSITQIDSIVDRSNPLLKFVEWEDPQTLIIKDGYDFVRIHMYGSEDGVYTGETVQAYEREELLELIPVTEKVRAWKPLVYPHEER